MLRLILLLFLLAAAFAETAPDVRRLAEMAQARMAEQNYAEAAHNFEALLKLRPQDAEARFALGVCYTQMDRLSEAAAELRRYMALQPRSAEGRAALGSVLLAEGLPDEAQPQLEIALRLDPSQPDTAKDLARCYELAGEPAKAVGVLRSTISASQADPDLRYRLAAALLSAGDAAGAVRELNQVHQSQSSEEIYILLARAQQKLGNVSKAMDLCERGMLQYPYSARLESVYLGFPSDAVGSRIEARVARLEAAATPDAAEMIDLARVIIDWRPGVEEKGLRVEMAAVAEKMAARAGSSQPRNPWARFQYARVLGAIRKYPEATAALNAALAVNPDPELQVLIYTHRALVELKQSHSERAREDFRKAMAINRGLSAPNPDAACEYARFLREESQSAEAKVIVDEALRWAPFHIPTRMERARLLADENRWKECIREATLVVRNSESESLVRSAHYLLARTYQAAGDAEHARAEQSWLESHKGAQQ